MIWLVFALGFAIAAFGATAGTALVTVSRAELTRAVSRRLRGGDASLSGLAKVDGYLTAASVTTSLGVLLLGASLPAVFAGSGLIRSAVVLALLAVPFVLFSGYFVPRWLTQRRAEAVAERVMPVLRSWSHVLGLILPTRPATGPKDFRAIWREGASVGGSDDTELLMAGGVMTFVERSVREVMTPRTEIVAIPHDAVLGDIVLVFTQSGYSRIPVYKDTLDDIIGMLHAFDLFRIRPGDPLPVRPVAAAPASRACGDLLLDMQRERRHLAVVLDEFGGTLGIVTLEDLLEELVGEIFDEHDEGVAGAPVPAPAVLDADGATPPSAVEERFGVTLPGAHAATIGGLLVDRLGRIPNAGERFELAGLEFDVIRASAARVERVLVRPGPVVAVPLPERSA
jgi:CBS domain containing-hemolysin-like protein